MKTRSSSGVGQKIELKFDVETLRITDDGEAHNPKPQPSGSELLAQIKNTSQIAEISSSTDIDVPKITANIQAAKLKSMLNNLKK